MRQYIIAVIALMSLLLIGSAFATEESAAAVQATQLQLNIDKALTVGASVIAKIEANATADTTELQSILDELTKIRNSIDVNSTTLESVKETRDQVKDLVKTFRDTAKDLLDDDVKAEIKVKAEKEFKAKFEEKIKKGDELRKEFNLKALERFAERQQHLALNLSADENVSLTPELEAKIADVRARIEANQVTRDQIAQIRTKIKVDAESLKADKDILVADIRENVLQQRVEMIERVIAYAQDKNVSTTELEYVHAKLVALLESYDSNNVTAKDFASQADELHKAMQKVLGNAGLGQIKQEISLETEDERIELRAESKAQMEAWREERKQIMEDLREGNKLRLELRKELKDGKLESESRYEVRNADGSRLEIRERMKDGVLETRIKERSADSDDDNNDDSNEVEDESEDESEDDDSDDSEDDN